ncbi:GTP pyrophosphokinase family protein [Pseudarthrobacter quantipunctorum]|uniref:RelA/SpoT domain-containing protein n=1 Tax=Pseudarthrobacter quantipunctorum TaxID=3128980 RepID=A0ABZ2R5A1_9MICC
MANTKGSGTAYLEAVYGLEDFGISMKKLIEQLLRAGDIAHYSVNYRVKSEESASKKLADPEAAYESFSSLHDLLGLRVTCYFSDDVNEVAAIIEKEFAVDPTKSEDKGKRLSAREFGYRSVHRVAQLGPQRADLAEYADFKTKRFEVQIRTVVQHAWAEIEHDLGYKQETTPEPISRRFSMLAGVLELVDYEFMALRDELLEYEKAADKKAKSPALKMALDQATLTAVLKLPSSFSTRLDAALVRAVDIKMQRGMPEAEYVAKRVRQLHEVGIVDMAQLREAVRAWQPHILDFSVRWIERPDSMRTMERDSQRRRQILQRGLPRGIGLFYMWLAIKAEAVAHGDEEEPELLDWYAVPSVWEQTVSKLGPPPPLPGPAKA